MKFSLVFAVVALSLVLVHDTEGHVTTREVKTYVRRQEPPMLFGRRGVNPNMNSLFFGKRQAPESSMSLVKLQNLCRLVKLYSTDMDGVVGEEVPV